jgi:hypothetical protein
MAEPHRGNIHLPPEGVARIYLQYNVPYGAHPEVKLKALTEARTNNIPLYRTFEREVNFEIRQLMIDIENYRE